MSCESKTALHFVRLALMMSRPSFRKPIRAPMNFLPVVAVVALVILVGSARGASNPTFSGRLDFAVEDSVVADVNGDGIPDLVAGNANGIYVTFGNGDGTFRPGPTSTISFQPSGIHVLDLNHDGAIDLLMTGGPDVPGCCVAISYGNGDGTFETAISFSAGENAEIETSAVGDFNGDGITDIVTLGSAGIYMFLGNLSGGFNAPVLTPVADVPDSAFQVLAADFNHDGVPDVVVSTTEGVSVFFGTGTGAFMNPVITVAGFKVGVFTSIAVADLKGDGNPDLVLVSNEYTFVLVYLGAGSGTFASPSMVTLPGNGFVIVADVNGDGTPDLIGRDGPCRLSRSLGPIRVSHVFQNKSSPRSQQLTRPVPFVAAPRLA